MPLAGINARPVLIELAEKGLAAQDLKGDQNITRCVERIGDTTSRSPLQGGEANSAK